MLRLNSYKGALLPNFGTLVHPELLIEAFRRLEDIFSTGRTAGMYWVWE